MKGNHIDVEHLRKRFGRVRAPPGLTIPLCSDRDDS
jgi:hypothetical protein